MSVSSSSLGHGNEDNRLQETGLGPSEEGRTWGLEEERSLWVASMGASNKLSCVLGLEPELEPGRVWGSALENGVCTGMCVTLVTVV